MGCAHGAPATTPKTGDWRRRQPIGIAGQTGTPNTDSTDRQSWADLCSESPSIPAYRRLPPKLSCGHFEFDGKARQDRVSHAMAPLAARRPRRGRVPGRGRLGSCPGTLAAPGGSGHCGTLVASVERIRSAVSPGSIASDPRVAPGEGADSEQWQWHGMGAP